MFSDSASPQALTDVSAAALLFVRAVERNRHRLTLSSGLTNTELRLLSRIAEQGEMSPNELAQSLNVTRAAITPITARLQDLGIISKTPHPVDRRSFVLRQTQRGQNLVEHIYAQFEDALSGATENLTAPEQASLALTLQRMATHLDRLSAPPG